MARWIAGLAHPGSVPVVGINGAQGTGKTTLAGRLREALAGRYGLCAVVLSLDDLYLPRAERERLAAQVHPLLRTRGVPGTHDVALAGTILRQLRGLDAAGGPVRIPKFVKAADDRAPASGWTEIAVPVDLVLFEGWCVGTPPQAEAQLRAPVNELEALEDADGRWRRYVNDQLAGAYARLFALVDRLLFLRAPDFASILRWRTRQEAQNVAEAAAGAAPGGAAIGGMDAAQLRRFVQHYERLTRHALEVLPRRADLTVELGPQHEMLALRYR
ncbi:MAG: kinase [Nevskia sp.]|nr:kinase [Nevskia sp.]